MYAFYQNLPNDHSVKPKTRDNFLKLIKSQVYSQIYRFFSCLFKRTNYKLNF